MYWSSYSSIAYCSIASCSFNRPMVDLVQNNDKSLDWTAPAFKSDQLKRKGNMESKV